MAKGDEHPGNRHAPEGYVRPQSDQDDEPASNVELTKEVVSPVSKFLPSAFLTERQPNRS